MDFTEIYKQTASLVSFSPGAHFLLTAVQDRLVVRRADSFQITRSWALDSAPSQTTSTLSQTTPGNAKSKLGGGGGSIGSSTTDGWVTHAGWSCDAEYVLGACAKKGVVEVFKMRDEAWRARIESGAEGLVKAEWANDGRSVVCWSEWGLRVTVWSLVTGTATYIQYPANPDRGYTFRSDGHYLVLAERHKSRDALGVYDTTAAYRLVRHFPLPTSSLAGLALSPTGNDVAVWEGALEPKLHVVTLAGNVVGTFSPSPEKDCGFGVRMVAWHPAGLFLALLGWDDRVYILESLTWGPIATLELQSRIPAGVAVWREPDKWVEATHGRGFLSYERLHAPHTLSLPSRDRTKPPAGISAKPRADDEPLAWNVDGTRLLVRFDGAPRAVHLFSFPKLGNEKKDVPSLAPRLRSVLLHTQPVECARWNPVRRGSLAICAGGGAMYLWSDEWESADGGQSAAIREPKRKVAADDGEGEEVAECVGVPAKKFSTHLLRWAPDGCGLILLDRDTFCCAFEVEEEDEHMPQSN